MAVETALARGNGHPWGEDRPGWDGMFLWADTEAEFAKAQAAAESKFWRLWLNGIEPETGKQIGYFYKPSGMAEAWEPDEPALDFFRGRPWEVPAKKPRA